MVTLPWVVAMVTLPWVVAMVTGGPPSKVAFSVHNRCLTSYYCIFKFRAETLDLLAYTRRDDII